MTRPVLVITEAETLVQDIRVKRSAKGHRPSAGLARKLSADQVPVGICVRQMLITQIDVDQQVQIFHYNNSIHQT